MSHVGCYYWNTDPIKARRVSDGATIEIKPNACLQLDVDLKRCGDQTGCIMTYYGELDATRVYVEPDTVAELVQC